MLDLDESRPAVPPRLASTLILLRACADRSVGGFEVCAMQRSLQSAFMGGALVFPGGRADSGDARARWTTDRLIEGHDPRENDGDDAKTARITACREALEEVGLAPLVARGGGPVDASVVARLRAAIDKAPGALRDALAADDLVLDLSSLVPLSRWVTPIAEQRRFDTRFFVARAPEGQVARVDDHEAIRVVWSTPQALLRDFEAGAISLFPPTHRTLEWLASRASVEDVLRDAAVTSLAAICPVFKLENQTSILALPGDPIHPIAERRIDGPTRYVLRGDRWRSEDAS